MAEHEPDDPLPALIAELDQAMAMSPLLARTARSMYDAFKGEAFADKQALYLTAAQILGNPGTAP